MIKNIVIQAGGKGERAGRYAKNKPKCLISIHGKPLLFHVCDAFPSAQVFLILSNGSKNEQVIKDFLTLHQAYKNRINIVSTKFKLGDSASLKNVLSSCQGHTLICWSDILFKLPSFDYEQNIVFTTNTFPCRWRIQDGVVQQATGDGIMGCFYVNNPQKEVSHFLNDGCIITTLQDKEYHYATVAVDECAEFGIEDELLDYYSKTIPVRNYNKLIMRDTTVEKSSVDAHLIQREINWYEAVYELGYRNIPDKISNYPFILERINGSNLYEHCSKGGTVTASKVFDILDKLHAMKSFGSNIMAHKRVVIDETVKRLKAVTSINKIFKQKSIVINSRDCFNYLNDLNLLQTKLQQCLSETDIVLSHGDPILSNILIDKEENLYLIDPRGYYGDLEGPVGTKMYDFAKLYFSSVMNFDTFNKKLFSLDVTETIDINIDVRAYCKVFEAEFEHRFDTVYINKLKLLAATMWLRFGSCILDDYDSIVGSLAYGLYLMSDLS